MKVEDIQIFRSREFLEKLMNMNLNVLVESLLAETILMTIESSPNAFDQYVLIVIHNVILYYLESGLSLRLG